MPPHRAAGAELSAERNIAELCDRQRGLGQVGVMDHHDRRGIADNELQLGNGEAIIERQEHRTQPEAGELHLHRIRRVQRQHRDTVAALHLQRIAQMAGKSRDARHRVAIGERRPLARSISAVLSGLRRP